MNDAEQRLIAEQILQDVGDAERRAPRVGFHAEPEVVREDALADKTDDASERDPSATENAPERRALAVSQRRRRAARAERSARTLHQVGLDEHVDVAVQHAIDIADLLFGPVILHELIRVQHVAANLAAERDLLLGAADLIELGLLLLHLQIEEARLQHLIAESRLRCCDRSFWHDTTMPVGRCVMRIAESVTLTCWPPAPLDR
jgi:hypothetical protein